MNRKANRFIIFFFLVPFFAIAQQKKLFAHSDTLRGSITPERAWWNVLRYDIIVKAGLYDQNHKGKECYHL
jgi:hypothetical protein